MKIYVGKLTQQPSLVNYEGAAVTMICATTGLMRNHAIPPCWDLIIFSTGGQRPPTVT